MLISGFTFCKNALSLGYPILESILSILPICNEFIVADGGSTDGTPEAITSINSTKIRIVPTPWEKRTQKNIHPLAHAANDALSHCSGIWCIGLQADEVFHEKHLDDLLSLLFQYTDDIRVEGFALRFLNFFGNYRYIRIDRKARPYQLRIIRGGKGILSKGDSHSFVCNGRLISARELDIPVFHYNRVAPPDIMMARRTAFKRLSISNDDLYRDPSFYEKLYDYEKINLSYLKKFDGDHPACMLHKISEMNQFFHPGEDKRSGRLKGTLRRKLLDDISRITGYRPFLKKTYQRIS